MTVERLCVICARLHSNKIILQPDQALFKTCPTCGTEETLLWPIASDGSNPPTIEALKKRGRVVARDLKY